jgi:hypothetical protein
MGSDVETADLIRASVVLLQLVRERLESQDCESAQVMITVATRRLTDVKLNLEHQLDVERQLRKMINH